MSKLKCLMAVRTLGLAGFLAVLAGCASTANQRDPRTLPPVNAKAPAPFTAEMIRDATPEGRTYVMEVLGEGISQRVHVRFSDVSESGATTHVTPLGEDGKPAGETARERTTWNKMESHSTFPADQTTITEAKITVPAGTFRCWVYRVTDPKHDATLTMWFAVDVPGPPIKHDVVTGAGERLTTTIVAIDPPEQQADQAK